MTEKEKEVEHRCSSCSREVMRVRAPYGTVHMCFMCREGNLYPLLPKCFACGQRTPFPHKSMYIADTGNKKITSTSEYELKKNFPDAEIEEVEIYKAD